jgi:DNA-binding response OmpR family regulator
MKGTGAGAPLGKGELGVKTVLIADDEESLRALVQATLISDQYEIIQARDGNEALELATKHRPDVAILDVQMPGKSGLEVARAIKALPTLRTTVILLTSNSRDTDIAAGRAAGADLYLTKPFSPLELLTRVEQALDLA